MTIYRRVISIVITIAFIPVVIVYGANDPVTKNASPEAKALLDSQYFDLLTPGTELYNRWTAQVETVAFYLRKLQEAGVPVLWRPYHEMNGNWFWWGGRLGEYSTRAIYKQLFDRYVDHHKLTNLIWVWSVDRPHNPNMNFSNYYPGNDYLDIASIDIYGNDFSKIYYDSLKTLAQDKPLGLGEVGNPPAPDTLDTQQAGHGMLFGPVWFAIPQKLIIKNCLTIREYLAGMM